MTDQEEKKDEVIAPTTANEAENNSATVSNEQTPAAEIPIVFYCKDCRKIIKGEKVGAKYVYKCPDCKSENVAFGTPKSINSFYHLK